jgi:hypothetical protein|nr:hypothetical protein [uncultured Sphingobacterium sp.]
MKKLMMSLVAMAMLSSVASAKTGTTAVKENASVRTTTHRLANNAVKVIKETTEAEGAFLRCNFKVSIYSCDGVLLDSYTFTSNASNCSQFFAAMHDWVANN